ncbi:MAG TPA: SGNH/GDSL hydrolase family protein [Anaerohalosphaeraceae bacterium]|nr:SGNH/GDSL hydrolase family protein [Anaerohalosphaeraceae bacterium]
MPRFVRTKWRELLTLGCSIILSFFFAEWILWKWAVSFAPEGLKSEILMLNEVDPLQRKYVPRLYLNYSLNPEYRLHAQKDHNSFGYRGKEISLQKPDGIFRIVCLGASTTYTPFVSDWSKSYPAQLEHILRNKYGYTNVEVINAGTPGYTTWETLMNFAFRALDLNPDMIILYHAVNDFEARQVFPETYRGDNTGLRKSWEAPKIPFWQNSMILRLLNHRYKFFDFPGGILQSYVNAAGIHRNHHTQIRLDMAKKNPPIYFERNLRSILAIAKEFNVQVVLSTFAFTRETPYKLSDYFYQGLEEHNQVIQNLADRYGLPLNDFKKTMPEDIQYWKDTVHFSESGAYLQAKSFADLLHTKHLIPSRAGDPNE